MGVDNYISLAVLPKATCLLREEGSSGESLELLSDSRGVVAFYYRPESSATVTKDVLDCDDASGRTARYFLELRAAADVPALREPPLEGPIQPPLKGDPLAVTQEELFAQGYPTRPDPVQEPRAYETWLAAVTKPLVILPSETVASTSHRAASYTPNWAGMALLKLSGSAYLAVVANWSVPNAVPRSTGESNNALFLWAGVGGYGGGGMWQGGVDDWWLPGSQQHIRRAWVEFINASGPCCLINYPTAGSIYVGDTYFFEARLGRSDGYPTITGNDSTQYLWAYHANVTRGWTTGWVSWTVQDFIEQWDRQPGTDPDDVVSGITGNSAEWIIERPQTSANPVTYAVLPNFYWADIWNARAFDRASWSWRSYVLGPYRTLYMKDGGTGHVLATAERDPDYGDIYLWWRNYQ